MPALLPALWPSPWLPKQRPGFFPDSELYGLLLLLPAEFPILPPDPPVLRLPADGEAAEEALPPRPRRGQTRFRDQAILLLLLSFCRSRRWGRAMFLTGTRSCPHTLCTLDATSAYLHMTLFHICATVFKFTVTAHVNIVLYGRWPQKVSPLRLPSEELQLVSEEPLTSPWTGWMVRTHKHHTLIQCKCRETLNTAQIHLKGLYISTTFCGCVSLAKRSASSHPPF